MTVVRCVFEIFTALMMRKIHADYKNTFLTYGFARQKVYFIFVSCTERRLNPNSSLKTVENGKETINDLPFSFDGWCCELLLQRCEKRRTARMIEMSRKTTNE
jgi:hypothetical protein